MNRLKVGTRLAILAGIVSLVAAADGFLALGGMAHGKQRLETVYQDRTVALVQLGQVLYDTLSIRRQLDLAQEAPTQEQIDRALDEVAQLDAQRERAWQGYLSTRMTPEERQLVDRAEAHRAQLAKARNEVIAAYRHDGRSAGAAALASTHVDALFDGFHADMSRLIDLQARVARAQYDAEQSYTRFRLLLAATIAGGVLFSFGLMAWLARTITRPLAAAIDAAHSIAEGNFETSLPVAGKDEFGQLMHALLKMQEALRAMSGEIRTRIKQLEDMSNALPLAVFQARVSPDMGFAYNFIGQPALAGCGNTPRREAAFHDLRAHCR
ncbi:MCP four helix bundle domain-containing protein [Paraburkholderia sp. CNPSo 3274]|nr:MCP four helix bundle domain-containing protein [Paraburkholderia sp. CNPSo 3274]